MYQQILLIFRSIAIVMNDFLTRTESTKITSRKAYCYTCIRPFPLDLREGFIGIV